MDRRIAHLVQRHPAGLRAVVGPHFAQQIAVAVVDADGARSARAEELVGHRREPRRHEQQEHGGDEDERRHTRRAAQRAMHHGFFATATLAGPPTTKRVAAEAPQTSGEYMQAARVGGTTKSPGVVARAR